MGLVVDLHFKTAKCTFRISAAIRKLAPKGLGVLWGKKQHTCKWYPIPGHYFGTNIYLPVWRIPWRVYISHHVCYVIVWYVKMYFYHCWHVQVCVYVCGNISICLCFYLFMWGLKKACVHRYMCTHGCLHVCLCVWAAVSRPAVDHRVCMQPRCFIYQSPSQTDRSRRDCSLSHPLNSGL